MSVTVNKPYRFLIVESERGWKTEYDHEYFETYEEAHSRFMALQAKNGPAPDYYYIAAGPIEQLNEQGEWNVR